MTEVKGIWWRSQDPLARAQKVFVIVALLAWSVAGFATTLYALWQPSGGVQVWAVAFLAMSAAYLSGNLFGFLFALPRSVTVRLPDGSNVVGLRHGTVRPNTNLEDVSDWLTKIVVGLTLIQLDKIPGAATTLFGLIGQGLGGGDSATLFAGSLVIYSSLAGLMTAWIATRLFISQWMSVADRAIDKAE
jgi:hypothetical protein